MVPTSRRHPHGEKAPRCHSYYCLGPWRVYENTLDCDSRNGPQSRRGEGARAQASLALPLREERAPGLSKARPRREHEPQLQLVSPLLLQQPGAGRTRAAAPGSLSVVDSGGGNCGLEGIGGRRPDLRRQGCKRVSLKIPCSPLSVVAEEVCTWVLLIPEDTPAAQ